MAKKTAVSSALQGAGADQKGPVVQGAVDASGPAGDVASGAGTNASTEPGGAATLNPPESGSGQVGQETREDQEGQKGQKGLEDAGASDVLVVDKVADAIVSPFPLDAVLRNDGSLAVSEPVSGAFVSAGGNAHIALHDEDHALSVLESIEEINASNPGGYALRIDGIPGDLITEKGDQ